MMWRLVDDFAPNLPTPFRKTHQKFIKAYHGKPRRQTRQSYCIDMMGKMFGFELGSSFVQKYFPPSEKYAVQDMIGHIRDTLHETLEASSWLVNITKTEAMKKVKAMDFQVGYPDFIKEQDKIDDYYKNVSILWLMHPYEVNAYTNPFDNSILIPAGILQRPHYDNSLPNLVFRALGAMFDSEGAMRLWWDMESQAEFDQRLKCVADYYSGFTYRGKQAYHMKMENNPEEVYMPGLQMTNDQIFFLSFAQNYCKVRRPETVDRYLTDSEHMIEELRVKGTLSQVPAFAKVFKCKSKTTMNPQSRCSLWL
ncbi:hypothetical protein LSH36_491g05051 [Paralvinella palmiformis]|uniref:Endothelin-converting enzyme 1 n=1 Tax=Paralvinella palmiformis TaxID=53620 RepID=A0AAD9MX10_9ANNE|nr:hypothetical protein LSH36_491g05051 [Paralvinella palmiformis]